MAELKNPEDNRFDRRVVNAFLTGLGEHTDAGDPDETIAFGTDRYFAVNARLAESGRQALLAVPGEIEILLDGKRLLIQNPS